MRTTIDLPDDLHELARQLAHQNDRSMSEVVAELIRIGLRRPADDHATTPRGMPQRSIGRSVTAEDVRSLDDDE